MRRILIENARRKKALRHGGGQHRLDIQERGLTQRRRTRNSRPSTSAGEICAREDRRRRNWSSSAISPGLTIQQAADLLDISEPTAKRHGVYARAWLFHQIRRDRNRLDGGQLIRRKTRISPAHTKLTDSRQLRSLRRAALACLAGNGWSGLPSYGAGACACGFSGLKRPLH